jgi:hypothetical protein
MHVRRSRAHFFYFILLAFSSAPDAIIVIHYPTTKALKVKLVLKCTSNESFMLIFVADHSIYYLLWCVVGGDIYTLRLLSDEV